MTQDANLSENDFAEITAYENYISAIRDSETKRRYQGQLEMFFNPDYQWNLSAHSKIDKTSI